MTRIVPLTREQAADRDPRIAEALPAIEKGMGFLPEDSLVLARHPPLFDAVRRLVSAAYAPGGVGVGLKKLVAHMASRAAGCRYCAAHTAHGAAAVGVEQAKLDAIWSFDSDPLFSAAERSALHVARGAALTPNTVTDADMRALGEHFSDDQIVEIVGVIALFGFLNRWNATLDTTLEPVPSAFVHRDSSTSGGTEACTP